jgi:2-methylaconitate cis-trans-isomerase PrpF
MKQRLRAVWMRGGTSKALIFHSKDLPNDKSQWDALFLKAMGSPDRYGRQLNGMGGGMSSLSKVCVVGPPSVDNADVDYTFAQIQIDTAIVDYSGNCGNMSSAIGPFAVDEGLIPTTTNGEVCIRIHNTNTKKIIHSRFHVINGSFEEEGNLAIPGVDGTGSPVQLDFLNPGGASTKYLLPTQKVIDTLNIPQHGPFQASMVDAANACVFIRAVDVGLKGNELPDEIEARSELMHLLSQLRLHASVSMGIASNLEEAEHIKMIPFLVLVSSPQSSLTLDGQGVKKEDAHLSVRALSNGQIHRALPLTGALCTAVAASIDGSIANQCSIQSNLKGHPIKLAMPSGILQVGATVKLNEHNQWHAQSGSFFRTTRRLFDGFVYA